MNTPNATRGMLKLIVLGAALIAPATLLGQSRPQPLVSMPPLPSNIQVPEGNQAFLKASAAGTQNYLCLPSGWTFVGPQATLFVTFPWMNQTVRQQVATHFLSPNPAEGGTPRPVWQSSIDTSLVAAKPVASSSDPNYVDPTAIPWLLLQAVYTQTGPTGGWILSQTTYIQRINTSGGLMPSTACTTGMRAFVPYTAEYVFYTKVGA